MFTLSKPRGQARYGIYGIPVFTPTPRRISAAGEQLFHSAMRSTRLHDRADLQSGREDAQAETADREGDGQADEKEAEIE